MNPFDHDRPRLVCRLARGWAVLGDQRSGSAKSPSLGELPSLTEGHIAGCPLCRRFFDASQALDRTLVRDAQIDQPKVPQGLEQRIALAIARSQKAPVPARPRVRGATLAATAACAVAALVVIGLTMSTRPISHGSAGAPLSAAEERQLANAVVKLPVTLWESVGPSAAAAWRSEPLSREATDLASDARSAIGFLEANFLPTGTSAPRSHGSPSS